MNKKEGLTVKIAILAVFFTVMSTQAIVPGISTMLRAFADESYTRVMLIVTIPSLVSIISSLAAGSVAGKKVSLKKLAVFGEAFFAVSGVLPFFLKSLNPVLLCRVLYGLSLGILRILGALLIYEHIRAEERDSMMGLGVSIQNAGGIVFTLLGGWLAEFGWNYTFLSYAVGGVLLILVAMWLPAESTRKDPKTAANGPGAANAKAAEAGTNPADPAAARATGSDAPQKAKLPAVLYLYLVLGVSLGMILYPLSTNMSQLVTTLGIGTASTAALIITMYSLGSVLGGAVYAKKLPLLKDHAMSAGFLLTAIGLWLTFVGRQIPVLTAGSVLAGFGVGLYLPALYLVVGDSCHPSVRSLGMSLMLSTMHVGFFLSPYFYTCITSLMHKDMLFTPFFIGTIYYCGLTALFALREKSKGNTTQIITSGGK